MSLDRPRVASSGRVQRPPRSKNGCETCRKRKVRCNEQRPRCGHCERLNLQCSWRSNRVPVNPTSDVSGSVNSYVGHLPSDTRDAAFDAWDFNSMIWQDSSVLESPSLEWLASDPGLATAASVNTLATRTNTSIGNVAIGPSTTHEIVQELPTSGLGQRFLDSTSPASSTDAGGHALVEHFLASDVPPILAAVEVGPRWTSTKMLLASLAGSSGMVRNAIMAFSALRAGGLDLMQQSDHNMLYRKADTQLAAYLSAAAADPNETSASLPSALTTAFFLSYCDLLTNRVSEAQSLGHASTLIRCFKGKEFTPIERRLVAWIRLVDGRASSAGGNGEFLAETETEAYSPDVYPKISSSDSQQLGVLPTVDQEIEEILFDVLYSPGLIFYQRVQSIMARVSKIDPWHRGRGTVSDETEVMAIAAAILKDLRELEQQRPTLMDHAVAGSLTDRHLAAEIAMAITRSYRTYWANYEAGFIHLHRVAHKHLPATADVIRARSTIKRIAHLFDQSQDVLPVNFIWPLLMACCEEDDVEERAWMIRSIRNMQSLATNARPIADVLEEVHRRQDLNKQRADVRQTSLDMFNMSFAVV